MVSNLKWNWKIQISNNFEFYKNKYRAPFIDKLQVRHGNISCGETGLFKDISSKKKKLTKAQIVDMSM